MHDIALDSADTTLAREAVALRNRFVETSEASLKAEREQYLTPPDVASMAVSLFSEEGTGASCLDLGAGTGILAATLASRSAVSSFDLVEADPEMLDCCRSLFSERDFPVSFICEDALSTQKLRSYDRIILNPPYRKMAANDYRMSRLPVPVPNLYAAFLCIAVEHLNPGGEAVAIIPRSWTNGSYFKRFRKWLFSRGSIDAVVEYESRKDVFADSGVLQEIMLIKFSRKPQAKDVAVYRFAQGARVPGVRHHAFKDLVSAADEDAVLSFAPSEELATGRVSLREAGYCASTGKVVDYRVQDRLSSNRSDDCAIPLIYPCNLAAGEVRHPFTQAHKPQWLDNNLAGKMAIPQGYYVLVKRFSPKDESKRIKPFVMNATTPVAIENHVNVIHAGTPRRVVPLKQEDAFALARLLDSDIIDETFRHFGGSTQVNAGDLNRLPFIEELAYA